ncbi:MAG: Hpt domain-containing protein [Chromatiales bacterium]|nr:Hpt domain-containing protein [Chromatiales bacterium]
MGEFLDHSALNWLKKELDASLKQAGESLELYVEVSGDITDLQRCVDEIHQVHGTLVMLELFGAALCAEEMELLARALLDEKVTNRNDGFEILMRATLTLPQYLERLQQGQRDIPLALLPLLNDLRASRGAPLMTQAGFFAPDLRRLHGPDEDEGRELIAGIGSALIARQIRYQYHLGLLKLLRDGNVEEGLRRVADVIERLRDASRLNGAAEQWRIPQVLVEELLQGRLEANAAVKQLIGHLDHRIKFLIEQGERAFAAQPDTELLTNILYYLAGVSEANPDGFALARDYRLADAMPSPEEVQDARRKLSAPNAELLATVRRAIGEQVTQVKDGLDLYVRGSVTGAQHLNDLADLLATISDTLGMLGQGSLREILRLQVERLREAAFNAGSSPDEPMAMEIAKVLLEVESELETRLGHAVAEVHRESEQRTEEMEWDLRPAEYLQVVDATLHEMMVEMAKVKDGVVAYLDTPERGEVLESVVSHLQQVGGALTMLGEERARRFTVDIGSYLTERMAGRQGAINVQAEELADCITGLEYFLEALREQRSNRDSILAVAEQSLVHLREVSEEIRDDAEPAELDDLAQFAVTLSLEEETEDEPALTNESLPSAEKPPLEDLDEEILDIFLEEADEVFETITTALPRWISDPSDAESLTTVRRSFHTLKGSGRLVGARDIGELSWSIENMLNRVIDGTVPASEDVQQLVSETSGILPELIDSLRRGVAAEVDVAGLMAKADALAKPAEAVSEEAEPGDQETERPLIVDAGEEADLVAGPQAGDTSAIEEIGEEEPEALLPAQLETPLPSSFDLDEFAELATDASLEEWLAATENKQTEAEQPPDDEAESTQEPPVPLDEDFGAIPQDVLSAFEGHPSDSSGVSEESEEPQASDDGNLSFSVGDADFEEQLPAWASVVDPELADEPDLTKPEELQGAMADESAMDDSEQARDDMAEPAPADGQRSDEPVPAASDADAPLPIPDIDPVLLEIFSSETETHLDEIRAFLDRCERGEGGRMIDDSMIRALHTLQGSAHMAGVNDVAELGSELERSSKLLRARDVVVQGEVASVYADVVDYTAATLRSLAGEDHRPSGFRQLLGRIQGLAARVQRAPEEQVPPTAEAAQESDAVDEELVEIFREEAKELLQTIETEVDASLAKPGDKPAVERLLRALHTFKGSARLAGLASLGAVSHGMESAYKANTGKGFSGRDAETLHAGVDALVGQVEGLAFGMQPPDNRDLLERLDAIGGQMPSAEEAVDQEFLAEPVAEPEEALDPEMVGMFLEESRDLFEEVENAMQALREDPNSAEQADRLRRSLHTIKGSARLVGLSTIGDLSHGVETLLDPESGTVKLDGGRLNVVQRAMDRLVAMTEEVAAGKTPYVPADLIAEIEALSQGTEVEEVQTAPVIPLAPPEPTPAAPEPAAAAPAGPAEQIRVRADLLDRLVNNAGEVSIYRARLEQQNSALQFSMGELEATIQRLTEQLRKLEIETEAQILFRYERESDERNMEFDPLEMDRFSQIQQLSRALAESVNDLRNLQEIISGLASESETLLRQQGRVNTDLQEGLMRTRMVRFSSVIPRLRRVVRQTAQQTGKKADLRVIGGEGEMDRSILDRMLAPLEHMLRNAVAHGIELPDERRRHGKDVTGRVSLSLSREGNQVLIEVADDGGGIPLGALRRKVLESGFMKPEDLEALSDTDTMQLIMEPGITTAGAVTQIAGRGVGMDVVASEIKQLSGSLEIDSLEGRGSRFTVHLPFTLAITQALLVNVGDELYAVPHTSIEGVVRIARTQLEEYFSGNRVEFEYAGHHYEVRSLAASLGTADRMLDEKKKWYPVLLVRAGEHRHALQVDGLLGAREIVVKSVGPQLSTIRWISGGTILADGQVALILDVTSLVRVVAKREMGMHPEALVAARPRIEEVQRQLTVMVVDDSLTVRKVTGRLLERNDYRVVAAKDGVDAVALLQDELPDIMLLDIEMPRMDGYELARHMRNTERLKEIPIIMITSRVGEKHRQKAMSLGVNRYLGKPYQESELLDSIQNLLAEQGK